MEQPLLAVLKSRLKVLTNPLDIIFAAIDFEGCESIEKVFQTSTNSEFGIAFLDACGLLPEKSHKEPSPLISTQEFVTGTNYRWVRAMKNFRFEVAERIFIYNMSEEAWQCLNPQDVNTSVEALRVHNYEGKNDLRCLHGILDTARIANKLFERPPKADPIELEKLSLDPALPFEQTDFRTAGNDANCTLRVLLMLAIKSREASVCAGPQARLVALQQIAQAPLSTPKSESEPIQLLSLRPTEPLDDPGVLVDKRREKELTLKERVRRAANKVLQDGAANLAGEQFETRGFYNLTG
ncbi:hypothetical protein BDZ45DRAFT_753636 [Acephala macrosclerotiorum]|nr:hypothetical protein BDZ45DRAFT_753636 [Acephala macrosclerotiorum]